jgi:xanthine/uracil permease
VISAGLAVAAIVMLLVGLALMPSAEENFAGNTSSPPAMASLRDR